MFSPIFFLPPPTNVITILDLVVSAAAAKSLQSCPTLCDPIDGSPPGSPVPGILQARTLEWVAISFSSAWKWKVKVKWLSCVRLLATPWSAACQAPLSTGFSRREDWSGVPSPSPCCLYSVGCTLRLGHSFKGCTLPTFPPHSPCRGFTPIIFWGTESRQSSAAASVLSSYWSAASTLPVRE